MIIGCIITICTFIAAVLIGWNHMVKITKGPKNEKEIGYYQWNHDQMDSFLDITTFTYHGDRYETDDGGGDGAMSFGYLEASMKGRKPAFWLKETMNQTDKKIWKVKDRQKLEAYYTNFDNYNFKLTESKTNERKTISSKEAKQYARLQQIRKDAQNVKKQYTIYGESKDHIAYVEFDIMTVGGKQYLGKDEEW